MKINSKKFLLYDRSTVGTIYGGLGFLFAIYVGLTAFFISRFLSDHKGDWIVVVVFLLAVWLVMVLTSLKGNAWRKYGLRCEVDASGIRCSGLFWKPFFLPWQELHTCGFFVYQVSIAYKEIMLFALDRNLPAPKSVEEINAVSKDCIAVEYRREAWEAMEAYMPEDLRKRFEEAHAKQRNAFFRRG